MKISKKDSLEWFKYLSELSGDKKEVYNRFSVYSKECDEYYNLPRISNSYQVGKIFDYLDLAMGEFDDDDLENQITCTVNLPWMMDDCLDIDITITDNKIVSLESYYYSKEIN